MRLVWSLVLTGVIAAALSSVCDVQTKKKSYGRAYLGFDANDYPGDAALPQLRKTFAFAGYWLNHPPNTAPGAAETWLNQPPNTVPGAAGTWLGHLSDARSSADPSVNHPPNTPASAPDTWLGHRGALAKEGFGFLVLFNGRFDKELRAAPDPRVVGVNDAREAAATARSEGFPPGTVIFLDQEEGGSMYDEQMAYLLAWFDEIVAQGFRAGIYCSGMPASEGHGQFTVTADFIRARAGRRELVYFVYNDACPPAPGCVYLANPPQPSASGVPFASVWQFAQSPRRRNYTRHCSATYNRDGNCYAPGMGPGSPYVDLETSVSPDPSGATQTR